MRTPEEWADQLFFIVQDYTSMDLASLLRPRFTEIVRKALADVGARQEAENQDLRSENDLLRRGVWDSYLDHQAIADEAAKIVRGQIRRWLLQASERNGAEARKCSQRGDREQATSHADMAMMCELAVVYLDDLGPCVPLPPSEIEERVESILSRWSPSDPDDRYFKRQLQKAIGQRGATTEDVAVT